MRIIFILFFLISVNISFSQKTYEVNTSSSNRMDDKLYNKQTGEKINIDELMKINKENPGILFEHVFNKYGEIERYYYDPNNPLTKAQQRDIEKQTKPGELFPEFAFETMDGELLDSEKLRGSWIIIRFELFAQMIKKSDIDELDRQINHFEDSQILFSIICFADNKQNVKKIINFDNSNFKLVGDGRNFHEMFNIVKYPTTLILDTQGIVFKYYHSGDIIDLNKILKN